jgi:hypothetical protein
MQADKCDSKMGTNFFGGVVCNEHGIGGDNGAQLGRIIVLYHEASGG